jgi:hypothetical protein
MSAVVKQSSDIMAQRTRWMALVILLIVAGFLLASCSGRDPAGPLQTLMQGGQPAVDGAGVEIHPGESADFTAFVVNRLSTPVTLISASVVPVTGARPTGQLVHLGVSNGKGMAAALNGWPLPGLPTRQLAGARIGHGQSNIIFGITGHVLDTNYTVAGLKIRYRYQGRVYSVVAWSAAVACVASVLTGPRACPNIGDQIQAKVQKMAGGSS